MGEDGDTEKIGGLVDARRFSVPPRSDNIQEEVRWRRSRYFTHPWVPVMMPQDSDCHAPLDPLGMVAGGSHL
jgi:hypothetical protein